MLNNKKVLTLLLILGVAFWGISFPVTKLSIGTFSVSTFLFYRFVLATAAIALIFHKHLKYINFSVVKAGILLSIPLLFSIYLQTVGLVKHTSSAQCSFIAGMCVVIIPILKVLFYKEKVSLQIWLAVILAIVGLFIISITKDLSLNVADLYILVGTSGFAVYLIQVERYSAKHSIIPTLVPMFGFISFVMLAFSLLDSSANWAPDNQNFWVGIAYAAFFSTAYMYSISNITQKYLSAEKIALIYLLEPIFAAIAGYFILCEMITWRLAIGGLMIILATITAELKWKAK